MSPPVGALDPGACVSNSWEGGLEVYRRYGADIVAIGNSEVYSGLVASTLGGLSGLRSPKVLFLTRSNMRGDQVRASAKAMSSRGSKTEVTILGYSARNGARTGLASSPDAEDTVTLPTIGDSRGGPRLDWNELVDQSQARRFLRHLSLGSASLGLVEGFRVDSVPGGWGVTADIEAFERRDLLPRLAALAPVAYPHLWKDGDAVCDMAKASADLDRTLAALVKVSKRVIVFITPETPTMERGVPACFGPAVAAMVRSKAGPRVRVLTGDWSSYGLEYADYVFKYPEEGVGRLDGNHMNYDGALKVTARLGAELREALRTP
ncbi:MAG: hypothetical protein HYZ75_20000 [Elusimicrobia bacterium]|nr:hypothetical protein [Elusimicrobiota bacterium]